MINFFRKIRRKLADDNKPLKYMRYAIGEIVLVVIGILIALSINNWNEGQNEKKVELSYMQNLIEDLNENIETYHDFEKSNTIIYNLIDSIIPNLKSVDRRSHISNLSYWSRKVTMEWLTVNPTQRTFEEMKSSGHLRLIKDKAVANAISDYYNSLSDLDGYNKAAMLWVADYAKAMGKIFDGELLLKILREKKIQDAKPCDMLSEDPLVINELINSLQYFNGALALGEVVVKKEKLKAEKIINLITTNYKLK